MELLNTQTVCTTFNTSSTVTHALGGPFRMEIPQSSVMLAKPLSYEFRVAEYEDKNGDVVKVGLQVQVTEHDNYGVGFITEPWKDVPRVRLPFVG